MSDFRDPDRPIHRDPVYSGLDEPMSADVPRRDYGSGTVFSWIIGAMLLVGVLVFLFAGRDGTRTAGTDTSSPTVTGSSTPRAIPPGSPAATPSAPPSSPAPSSTPPSAPAEQSR